LVANRIPVDNRTGNFNNFIARGPLFSWLGHYILLLLRGLYHILMNNVKEVQYAISARA
jgi:hypothetical protein